MKCIRPLAGLALFALPLALFAADTKPATDYITYDNQPMGTVEAPLILRTFVQNLELDAETVARHSVGEASPHYSPGSGILNPARSYQPISGIPAAISVNAGPGLSYVWDTTECRLLYGWANGFLDMKNYWGEPKGGGRKSFGYVPYFVGNMFYKARGAHPLRINGESLPETIRYTGHSRSAGHPEFAFEAGGRRITVRVALGDAPQTLHLTYRSSNPADTLGYADPRTAFEVLASKPGELQVLLRPNAAETHNGYQQEVIRIDTPTAAIGAKLFETWGCIACHSTDGSKNHGPTLKGLAGQTRHFVEGVDPQVADAAYLRESISKPAAKTVTGFPPGMMPAYPLDEKQIEALVLFIQSIQ